MNSTSFLYTDPSFPEAVPVVVTVPSIDRVILQGGIAISTFAAAAAASGGKKRLFGDFTEGSDKAKLFQMWASRWLRRTVGISDKRLTFHSTRHSVKDSLTATDCPENVSRAILGHERGGGIHGKYGSVGVSPSKMLAVIEKVDPRQL